LSIKPEKRQGQLMSGDASPNSIGDTLRAETDDSPWRIRFETIYRQLRGRITLLHYPPGTRLNVDNLADEFNVSRTPIRTVLQRLEREGLAITRHGVGTAVTEIDFEHVREAMLLRMHLAELIGTLNPKEPGEDLLLSLETLQRECDNVTHALALKEFARIDMRLHDCKCSLIGNEPLKRTYDELYYRSVRMWFHCLPRMDWPTEAGALFEDLRLTRAALSRGDVKAMGFITRNAISAGLFRVHGLISNGGPQ
jgi:DNA-binding GntR family transcriptional regulator